MRCIVNDEIGQPLFIVHNHHLPYCGAPPTINGNDGHQYCSYFENVHGGQAIYIYRIDTQEGWLYIGYYGWETPMRVVNGQVPILLNEPERLWLEACWKATAL